MVKNNGNSNNFPANYREQSSQNSVEPLLAKAKTLFKVDKHQWNSLSMTPPKSQSQSQEMVYPHLADEIEQVLPEYNEEDAE